MSLEHLEDQRPLRGDRFDPFKHVSRTTPSLLPVDDEQLPDTLVDRFGRQKTYLRLSVTDRCNLSCTYCVPDEGVPLVQREEFLTLDHLLRVAQIGASLGITKLRVTGGEPTIRPGLAAWIKQLVAIDGIKQVGMTTNGVLLAAMAQDLADAGLKTLNVSIDAMDPDRFKAITRGGHVEPVLRGIEAARAAGLEVKLNTVALNDFTMDDAIALVEYAREHDLETRFIEFMPLCGTGWKQDQFRPLTGLKDALTHIYDLQPLPPDGGVAELYRIGKGPGRVGFIASLSANFCGACSRIRLTANGILRPCLFSQIGVDLRPLLLNDRADDELKRAFHEAVLNKPEGHGLKPENDWAGGETVSAWIRSTGG